ncbi:MAG: hypothetical protein A2648_01660 [Candidatus Lloydbacteria bacterium RIFCSPHIGHO2_01_FULL_41_20]|uniref:Alpha/beta hydrolase n=1 Tax=Candidatus Lloydbacteria bacterium RIFCSPHIGHO2_01_FULL_41_20 TaxID=1798657 RepID=A0A1G2CVA5_9BACT|nr:MAG: hypothetical protein A2648_01660 [Candidatus Lloydbacteria bacterium RIFCSPHIGHO2_01_FULL_41_20]
MKKRVFIIHGWGAVAKNHWFPWLKKELELHGYEVSLPDMPNTNYPRKELWLPKLASLVGTPDELTYFVGHSIGCNAILRYLESLGGVKVGGAVLVAPYYGDVPEAIGEEKEIADPWLHTRIDFSKVKKTTNNFVAIFSDNDDSVPIKNKDYFKTALTPHIIVEHDKGHFNEGEGVTELPSALNAILSFS